MGALLKSTWILLFAVLLFMMGNGLQGPLLGVRAIEEGFTTSVTGFVMSSYFAGLLFGALAGPPMVRRVGHIRVFSALASIASICILMQAAFVTPAIWMPNRFLTGMCMSGLYIVVESWLNDKASNANRGKLLAVYSVLQFGGLGLGQLLLNLAPPSGYDLFLLVSVLISVSLVPVSLANISAPKMEKVEKVGWRQLYRISPFGVVGLALLSISQSAMVGMSAVFGSLVGMSVFEISLFSSVPFLGAVGLLFPVAWFSDRLDRRAVAIMVTMAAALFALLGFGARGNFLWLLVFMTLYGGLSNSMYSILVAHANDNAKPEQMLSVCSGLVMVFGAGASVGPLLVGFAMDAMGAMVFLLCLAAIHVAIGIFGVYRMVRRAPVANQMSHVVVPMRATPVSASVIAKDVARRKMRMRQQQQHVRRMRPPARRRPGRGGGATPAP